MNNMLPKPVAHFVEMKANKLNLTVDDYFKQYKVVWYERHLDGVLVYHVREVKKFPQETG